MAAGLPHVLAVLFFVVLAVRLLRAHRVRWHRPLAQHDITQFQGGAQRGAAAGPPSHGGHEPLWTNSMFSGMPTYLISVHFPGDLVGVLAEGPDPGPAGGGGEPVRGAAVRLRAAAWRWACRPLVAVAGAVALGFSSYNLAILAAGHNTKSLALAYAPLVLGGLLVAFRRDKWLGAALFAVGLTLNVRANHPQITYYLGLLVTDLRAN
ncbi:MAG: hypothetical protein WKG07_05935 [Hymenobacter sp.]